MKSTQTGVSGVVTLDIEALEDERGFFARSWCAREFAELGLNPALSQCNISANRSRGTLRGMHLQAGPHAEAKLVRCTRGMIWDVAVDLRPGSPTYCRWTACELSVDNHRMIYIPEGCAHGFITLTDDAEVFYQMSVGYDADSARGVRWDDPAFAIEWPIEPVSLAARDASFEDFIP